MPANKQFDDLDIALYHLSFLGNLIDKTFIAFTNILDKVETKDERILFVTVSSYTLVQVVSFMDEFDNHIKSPDMELSTTINAIKKAVKPAIEEIRSWKDITHFRNNVLAHNLRNKKLNMSVFELGLESYDIPKYAGELAVVQQCINMITRVFESAFEPRIKVVQLALDSNKKMAKPSKYKTIAEAKKVTDQIMKEINSNIKSLKEAHGE